MLVDAIERELRSSCGSFFITRAVSCSPFFLVFLRFQFRFHSRIQELSSSFFYRAFTKTKRAFSFLSAQINRECE